MTSHPAWCSISRCTAAGGGDHEREPVALKLHRRARPRVLLTLHAPVRGYPVSVRLVVIAEVIVAVDMTVDEAHLVAASLTQLTEEAMPGEPND